MKTSTATISRLSFLGLLLAVNIFWLGLNIRNNAVGAIFMPYLVDKFVDESIRNTALGAMRTAGLIIAMLVQPAMGLLSDRSTSRFGRRRPFLAAGVLLDVILLAAIALANSYWALLAAVMLLQVSSNISHGALQGLIPDLVPEEKREQASAVKAIFELLPVVLLGITVAPLVGAGRLDLAVVFTAAALVAVLLITIFSVREQPLAASVPTRLAPDLWRVLGMIGGIFAGGASGLAAGCVLGLVVWLAASLFTDGVTARLAGIAAGGVAAMAVAVLGGSWAGVRLTLGRPTHDVASFRWWVANRLMFLTAVTSIQGFLPYFLMYAFGASSEKAAEMTGQLLTTVGIFTLASAILAGWLSGRFRQRTLVAISGILAAAGTLIVLLTVWRPDLNLLYAAGVFLGLATGQFVTINWAMGTQLVPPHEAGRWLGVSNLAGAGAGMIGSGLGGPISDLLNQGVPGLGWFTLFSGYALLFLLSAACLYWVRPALTKS